MTYHANMVFDDSDLPRSARRPVELVATYLKTGEKLVIRYIKPQLTWHSPLFRCYCNDHCFEADFSEAGLRSLKRKLREYLGVGTISRWEIREAA